MMEIIVGDVWEYTWDDAKGTVWENLNITIIKYNRDTDIVESTYIDPKTGLKREWVCSSTEFRARCTLMGSKEDKILNKIKSLDNRYKEHMAIKKYGEVA